MGIQRVKKNNLIALVLLVVMLLVVIGVLITRAVQADAFILRSRPVDFNFDR